MTVVSCLQECHELGVPIDRDLYNSLWMTLVAGRHLAVASPEPSKTAEVIGYICNLWGFKERTRIVHLRAGMSFEVVAPLLHSQLAVVVFVSLEFTDSKFQQELASFMNSSSGAQFSMVSVMANQNSMEVSLRQSLEKFIWLREVHRGEVPETASVPLCSASEELEKYRSKAKSVKIVREVRTYIYDIVVFTRMHRMVVAGLPTQTWKDMESFVQIYAAIHDMDYVTPAMVKLAAAKVIPLHIRMVSKPEMEPSVLYGSDPKLVQQLINVWDADLVVEDVLNNVQPPT